MKRVMGIAIAGVAVFALSGCGEGGDDNGGGMDTHFLTDVNGNGIGGVPYACSVGASGTTEEDGAYGFDSDGDNCTFIFNQTATDKPLYVKNASGAGVSGLEYQCTYNTHSGNTPFAGQTDGDGHVKHVWGHNGTKVKDECTLKY